MISFSSDAHLEPFFSVTVTSNRYCETLGNFLRPKIKEYENTDTFWFQ